MAKRYAELRQDRRRSDWHDLAINLVIFITVMAAYLIGLIVLLRIFPYLGPRLAAQIVWLAIAAASGGVAFRLAGRALKQRHIR